MTPWLVQLPQARTAPEWLRASLRVLDPTAEILYFGGPRRWSVGKVRPTDATVASAQRMLRQWMRVPVEARQHPAKRARLMYIEAALQGFRPVLSYSCRDLDGRVLNDWQESYYAMQRTTESEFWQAMDERGPDPTAEFGDYQLAADAWRYAFTRSHSLYVNPTRERALSSARTRIRTA